MAATYLEITTWPLRVIAGFQHQFRVTARNSNGTVDTGYTGMVAFLSTDPAAVLPAPYTFVGGDAGTKIFVARMKTNGQRSITATDGVITPSTTTSIVAVRPPGWGFDDEGLLPYGDAAGSIGASISGARAISTREVQVDVSNLVQDNSPFLAGDALNPNTWTVQRQDTLAFLHVVSVTQTGTYQYTLLTLEEFGSVSVTHTVSSNTLLDLVGNLITTPRSADFLGVTDEDKDSLQDILAKRQVAAVDIANPQFPQEVYFAGTLQLDAGGDYRLESGPQLTRKLMLRRMMSTPRDFFHLPDYGIGFRLKEPIPITDLGKMKTRTEQQLLREPELQTVLATIIQDSNGMLSVRVRAVERKTGQSIEVGFSPGQQAGVTL